jgi:hypothetical protein
VWRRRYRFQLRMAYLHSLAVGHALGHPS